jgi:hypothetical protein
VRVLFLTGALYTTGEVRVALSFAQALRDYGDEVSFVSSALSAELVRGYGFQQMILGADKQENSARFSDWLRQVSPDVVILADYYLFMTDDLQSIFAFDDLASLAVPILTLDNVGLSPDEQVLSWTPLQATYVVKSAPDFIQAIIRPCPPHDPSLARERTVYAKVYEALQLLPPAEREAVRGEIGCGDEDRIIFYALPRWVYSLAGRVPWLYTYYMFLGEIFARYFKDLDHRVHFVFVSPRRLLQSVDGAVRAHWLKSLPGRKLLPERRFRSFVLSADLFITDSILSFTLGLALFGLVPSISLMNTVTVQDLLCEPRIVSSFSLTAWARELTLRMHKIAPGSVFPFAWFPLGFLEEVERLHDGSAFLRAVERCELFDEVNTWAAIHGLLFDGARRAQIATLQRQYAEKVLDLPGFPELLRQIV